MFLDRLILGTAGLGGVWGKVDPEASVQTVLEALEAGIYAIDTAPAYGDAESFVGKALRQWEGTRPAISSKVGRLRSYAADKGRYDYSEDGMRSSVESSLKTLDVTALDILFLHDPEAMPPEQADRILSTLVRFREQGFAKAIGLGGNCPEWFRPYLRPGVFDVIMEFNRLNACTISALRDTLPYCTQHHIRYFAASPLNMGLLGRRFADFAAERPDWMPAEHIDTAVKLAKIAGENGIPLAALAHRFLLSLPCAFNIVIGASDPAELRDSIAAFSDGPLPERVMKIIKRYAIGSSNL